MIVRKIALQGWRNYAFAAAEFSPGTNVITGENAQGKTNLLGVPAHGRQELSHPL